MRLAKSNALCTAYCSAPLVRADRGQANLWLPGLVSQSVLRDAFEVRLRSLARWARRQVDEHRAEKWAWALAEGRVKNRAQLAHQEGLSRARITQVLKPFMVVT